MADSPQTVICLIHGTIPSIFGFRCFSEPEWIAENSWFRKNLLSSAQGSTLYSPFRWSGKNSHRSRVKAAEDLASHLCKLRQEYPNSIHLCIAHSHGGNVAAYAMRILKAGREPYLPHKLVTLGTPFFWAARRDHAEVRDLILSIAGWGTFVWAMFAVAWYTGIFFGNWWEHKILGAASISLTIFGVLSLIGAAIFLKTGAMESIAERQLAMLSTEIPPQLKVLCVSAQRDEARIYLKALESINRICFGEWQIRICRLFLRGAETLGSLQALLLVFRITQVGKNIPGVNKVTEPVRKVMMTIFVPFACVILAASALGLIGLLVIIIGTALLRSGPWGFGENLLLHWLLQIEIKETPMDEATQTLMNFQSDDVLQLHLGQLVRNSSPKLYDIATANWEYSRYSFQHSLMYSDARVCEFIDKWMIA